jgi:hypothetical protein
LHRPPSTNRSAGPRHLEQVDDTADIVDSPELVNAVVAQQLGVLATGFTHPDQV